MTLTMVHQPPAAELDAPQASPWSVRAKIAASVVILLHLAAVISSPLAGPPPSSELEKAAGSVAEPYLQALYLNHGYRFFAPNPGPGQIVRYELEMPDGTTREGHFPDRHNLSPRLYYHRHLILAAYIGDLSQVSDDPKELDAQIDAMRATAIRVRQAGDSTTAAAVETEAQRLRDDYVAALARKRTLLRGLADYLLEANGARRVFLYARERQLPAPWQARAGIPLDDPQFLAPDQLLGVYDQTANERAGG
jgi:hypothetical protein